MSRQAVLDGFRVALWWILVLCSVVIALLLRKNRSRGWTLWRFIFGTIICQTVYMTMWSIHNSTVRNIGLGRVTDNLYRLCIPLEQLATASFLGLLLLLAAGYCITRNNLGPYKFQLIGLPLIIFVTGVVTQYINFQMLEATTDQLDIFELSGWEAGLFAVCTFLNIAAFLFWVVYIFEIIQAEVDALRAQQELNLVRNAAPSSSVAPFPAEDGVGGAPASQARANGMASDPHAAPPPGMDPDWARAAAEEGIVAYKNLLGPGQNMSHIPGADVEAQEITTVADMLNFETKSSMYKKFTTGFSIFIVAQLCVFLSPVFIIDIVQDVITLFQFLVVYAFLAALLWLFRPVEDSPYLLMGDDISHLDTSLGVEDDEQQDRDFMSGAATTSTAYSTAAASYSNTAATASGSGLEMTAAAAGLKGKSHRAAAAVGNDRDQGGSWDKGSSRDQSSPGAAPAAAGDLAAPGLPLSNSARDLHPDTPAALSPTAARPAAGVTSIGSTSTQLPVSLPAIRTSVPGQPVGNGVSQQQQQQLQPVAAFSLGDEDDLQEIKLSSSPVKLPRKID